MSVALRDGKRTELQQFLDRSSFIELTARERAHALLDPGTFRELLGPFDRLHSPWLEMQNIVVQEDDGVVVARGTIDGQPAVIAAIESAFQGGSMGEIAGQKIVCALEFARRDHERGIPTRPVLLLETGGVRLQEANLGLAVIAEIHDAIVALRKLVPVVGVVAGTVGCFGGMSLAAALCSHLILTREGRLAMNGPEVIEQEAGIEELDATDKRLIWSILGGEQRHAAGLVDELVADDVPAIGAAVRDAFLRGVPERHRTEHVELFLERLASVDPAKVRDGKTGTGASRGRVWFTALSRGQGTLADGPASVLRCDAPLGGEVARLLAVVPNPHNRFPRARNGEVGLEEGWTLARYVRETIDADANRARRPIVAIVDVTSQAYGRTEELAGLHLACAAAADAYAAARLAGHPVVALLVGHAMSGAFLAHGYQANRILALDDPNVLVHAMGKAAAARITKRTVAEVDSLGETVLPMSYNIRNYARLGVLHKLIEGVNADAPGPAEVVQVREELIAAIADARNGPRDLTHRVASPARAASAEVRRRMADQWSVGAR